jgi:predicted dithiol-disulfide oxidoreductase (DUF899 family)
LPPSNSGWAGRSNGVSSHDTDFNHDFGVTFSEEDRQKGKIDYNHSRHDYFSPEAPRLSACYKDTEGTIFHTYSCHARGLDGLNGVYQRLDLAPKGRDETSLDFTQSWVRHHHRYED